jgi:hypothetical protein
VSYLPFLVPTDRLSDFGTGLLLGEASLKECVTKLPARGRIMKHLKCKTPQAKLEQPEVKHEIQNLDVQKWKELFDWCKGKH